MWILQETTPKVLPTWTGGKLVASFKNTVITPIIVSTFEPITISTFTYASKYPVPYMVGFRFANTPSNIIDISGLQLSLDLNSLHVIYAGDTIPNSSVEVEFYFNDQDNNNDLLWVKNIVDGKIEVNNLVYKTTDLNYLNIDNNSIIKLIVTVAVNSNFFGIMPTENKKKGYKIPNMGNLEIFESILFGGVIYHYDQILSKKRTFFKNGSDLILWG